MKSKGSEPETARIGAVSGEDRENSRRDRRRDMVSRIEPTKSGIKAPTGNTNHDISMLCTQNVRTRFRHPRQTFLCFQQTLRIIEVQGVSDSQFVARTAPDILPLRPRQ